MDFSIYLDTAIKGVIYYLLPVILSGVVGYFISQHKKQKAIKNRDHELIEKIAVMVCRLVIYAGSDATPSDTEMMSAYGIYKDLGGNGDAYRTLKDKLKFDPDVYLKNHESQPNGV